MAQWTHWAVPIGRKNYLFFGRDDGRQTGAVRYNVVASARRQWLDPFAYLREVLAKIADTPLSELDALLPDRWTEEQLEEIAKAVSGEWERADCCKGALRRTIIEIPDAASFRIASRAPRPRATASAGPSDA